MNLLMIRAMYLLFIRNVPPSIYGVRTISPNQKVAKWKTRLNGSRNFRAVVTLETLRYLNSPHYLPKYHPLSSESRFSRIDRLSSGKAACTTRKGKI